MNTIKNIHKLADVLSQDQIEKLEAGAKLHLRNSNISFKIIGQNESELIIQAEQGKHLSENYADVKTLITRTRELFSPFLPGRTIKVQPIVFSHAIVDVVDTDWINERMLKKGVKIRDIVADTGIDKTNLSAWINNKRVMSQPVKAMFYFYLTR